MRKMLAAGIGTALLLLVPLQALAQEEYTDPELGSHIQPAKPKGRQPIPRKQFDKAVEKLFKQADTNGDGTITLAEFNAVINARKAAVIQSRFDSIDTNRDKSISFAEFDAWQRSLGSVALAANGSADQDLAIVPEDIKPDVGRTENDEVVARLIEPLNPTMLTAANTNYDAGVSLAELLAYEGKRWDAADTNHDGWLTIDEIANLHVGGGGFGGRGGGFGERRGPGGPRAHRR
jgi:hypothetical protein